MKVWLRTSATEVGYEAPPLRSAVTANTLGLHAHMRFESGEIGVVTVRLCQCEKDTLRHVTHPVIRAMGSVINVMSSASSLMI